MSSRLSEAIKNVAARYNWDPLDLATVMSYETGGSFDEWKAGPTTQWGQHRGLIQWGEPQRKRYGVYKGMPVEEQVAAVGRYLTDAGVKPGDGILPIYAAINAGNAKKIHASDANNGGAPGTVLDKVRGQMGGHRKKAAALLGGTYTPIQADPYEGASEGLAPIDYDIHQGTTAPPINVPPTPSPEAYSSVWEQMKASAQSDWYTTWAWRKMTSGAVDPAYQGPSAEEWEQVTKTVPDSYYDYLLGAGSKDDYMARLKVAQEDTVRQERLAAGGWTGFAARLVTGMADPVTLPLNLLSGGFAAGAKGGSTAARVGAGALTAGTSNMALELGARDYLDDPNTDPMMAFGVGALLGGIGGALARNPATSVEAQEMARIGQETLDYIHGGFGSGGATRNTTARDSLIGNEWELQDMDVPTAVGGWTRQDAAGQMTTADEPLTRMLGAAIFEEPAGFKDHSVVPDSVTVRATALERRLVGNLNATFHTAMREYVGDISRLDVLGRARKADEFREAVDAWVQEPHPDVSTPAPVAKAGQALRQFYDSFRQEINDAGLGNLDADPHYTPKYADHTKIAEIDTVVDQEVMYRFVKNAIQKHSPDLEDALAERMAKGYWNTIRKAGWGIDDGFNQSLGLGDKDAFKRAFLDEVDNKGLLSEEELDRVFDLLSGLVDKTKTESDGSKGIARLKRRTLMDYNYAAQVPLREGGNIRLSVRDLFVKDAEFQARRYARSMSGRVAFAKTQLHNPTTGELLIDGIRSENDLAKIKRQLKEAYRKRPGGIKANQNALNRALANIDYGWNRINGIPVYGQDHWAAQVIRRVKAVEFIRLMSNMGLNQIQETWKVAAMTGFRAAITQLPALRRMTTAAGRSVAAKDNLLRELEAMTGIGLDGLWGKADFRFEDERIGSLGGRMGRMMDNVLDFGSAVTAQASLMRSIHDFQQRWAIKAITQQLYGIAKRTRTEAGTFDLGKLPRGDRERLASIGLGDKEVQGVFADLLAHAQVEKGRLIGLGSKNWSAQSVTKFTNTLSRYTDRLVQQNDVGGLHRWMSAPAASLFVQFRSFVLGAWAKSTLYNLHHMDPRMMVFLLGELAFGVGTYMVRQGGAAIGSDEDQEKFWTETMEPTNLLKNGVARTATASILPMLVDTGLFFTPWGPQFGSARASGSPTDAIVGSAAGGHIADLAKFTKGAIDSVVDDRELAQSEIKAGIRSFVPLGNFMPLTALFSHLIEDRRPSPPRDR